MSPVTKKDVASAIAQLMPFIIQGAHIEFLANKPITQTQFLILVAIYSNERCTMKTLADNMHVSMPTVSGIVDRLVRAGYLERSASDEDRRHVVVELTSKGEGLIKQFQQAISLRWQEVLGFLEPKDLEYFERIIKKLIAGIRRKV